MKKQIAIFASGDKERTEEIIRRFNGGERACISLILTDRENSRVRELDGEEGVEVIHFGREEWHAPEKIINLLHDRRIELIVLDDFRPVIPDDIRETFAHRIIDLEESTVSESPVVIMKRLMRDRTNPDKAWAEALGMNYDEEKIRKVEERQEEKPAEGNVPPPYNSAGAGADAVSPTAPDNFIMTPPVPSTPPTPPTPPAPPMPPTYLVLSVIITLVCCFVPGLVAIFFSAQVSSKYYAGDYGGAARASKRAEIWIIVSFVLGLISATLYFPLMLVRGML